MEYTPDGHSELYRWDDFLGITGGHAYSAMAMLSAITGCRIQAYGTDTLIYRASLGSSAAAKLAAMSEGVRADMRRFLEAYESDPVDPKALKIKGVGAQQVVEVLKSVYLR